MSVTLAFLRAQTTSAGFPIILQVKWTGMVIPIGTPRRASFHLQRRYLWGSREKGVREKCNLDAEVSSDSPLGQP